MISKEYLSKNSPIIVDYKKGFFVPDSLSRLHYHPYHEISVIKSGDISYSTENSNTKATDFCVIFSQAHKLHNPFVAKDHLYERYQVKFYGDILDRSIVESGALNDALSSSYMKKVNQREFAELYGIIEALYHLVKENEESDFNKLREVIELVSLIIKCHTATHISAPSENSYITEVAGFIKDNIDKKLTHQDIANRFFISKSKLIYDFKECYNMNILEYITMTKIDAAKELLLKGFSVAYTAEKCGFSSPSYFIKVFSDITKVTPLAFQFKWSTKRAERKAIKEEWS